MHETIIAPATPPGRSALGMVRISGTKAFKISSKMFDNRSFSEKGQKGIYHGRLFHHKTGKIIDETLIFFFPAPDSYTGEDVVEISCHGNPLVIKSIIDSFVSAGARIAAPGEFTQRAYLNGKLDLTQAEAVNDMANAYTSMALASASSQLGGTFSNAVREIDEMILDLLSRLEAAIDHSDIEETTLENRKLLEEIEGVKVKIESLLKTSNSGKVMREGMKIAIAGSPNVGKSSLMNALLKKDRSIVTDIPGTTRDSIEDEAGFMGIPVILIDTAGIRKSGDKVEKLGIDRALSTINNSDLRLVMFDASRDLDQDDERLLSLIKGMANIYIINKTDLPVKINRETLFGITGVAALEISSTAPKGLDTIEKAVSDYYFSAGYDPGSDVLVTNLRHENLLKNAFENLSRACSDAAVGVPEDIIASSVRRSMENIGELLGKTCDDSVLERIFSNFCIGK